MSRTSSFRTATSLASTAITHTAEMGLVVTPDTTDSRINHFRDSSSAAATAANPSRPATSNGQQQQEAYSRTSPQLYQASTVSNGKPTSPLVATSNAMSSGGTQVPQTVSSKDPKAAAQAAGDMRNIVRRKLTGYVGFANLPNQWHRKSVRKGFNFNVMVVGE